jgi:hypothetical protein
MDAEECEIFRIMHAVVSDIALRLSIHTKSTNCTPRNNALIAYHRLEINLGSIITPNFIRSMMSTVATLFSTPGFLRFADLNEIFIAIKSYLLHHSSVLEIPLDDAINWRPTQFAESEYNSVHLR